MTVAEEVGGHNNNTRGAVPLSTPQPDKFDSTYTLCGRLVRLPITSITVLTSAMDVITSSHRYLHPC